jgi:DUF971 family protein
MAYKLYAGSARVKGLDQNCASAFVTTGSGIMGTHWPTELKLAKDKRSLAVTFEDGSSFVLPAEYLRVESPSAEVQGHSPSQRKTVPGKRNVEIIAVAPVGNYAVKLTFDDMHDTGIYGWDALHELGTAYSEKWQAYCDDLAAKGLSRDPAPRR